MEDALVSFEADGVVSAVERTPDGKSVYSRITYKPGAKWGAQGDDLYIEGQFPVGQSVRVMITVYAPKGAVSKSRWGHEDIKIVNHTDKKE